MNCNVIKDLLPLYIDGCCSEESVAIVEDHIRECAECRTLLEDMKMPSKDELMPPKPVKFSKLDDRKAAVLQSVLLYLSFVLITAGVALESRTPVGLMNGFWAFNLVIPATGFMLSLSNWYFVRVYRNRKHFSISSLISTFVIILCAYIWGGFHYEINLWSLFAGNGSAEVLAIFHSLFILNGIGISLTVVFCVLSKTLSIKYAKMLGKE